MDKYLKYKKRYLKLLYGRGDKAEPDSDVGVLEDKSRVLTYFLNSDKVYTLLNQQVSQDLRSYRVILRSRRNTITVTVHGDSSITITALPLSSGPQGGAAPEEVSITRERGVLFEDTSNSGDLIQVFQRVNQFIRNVINIQVPTQPTGPVNQGAQTLENLSVEDITKMLKDMLKIKGKSPLLLRSEKDRVFFDVEHKDGNFICRLKFKREGVDNIILLFYFNKVGLMVRTDKGTAEIPPLMMKAIDVVQKLNSRLHNQSEQPVPKPPGKDKHTAPKPTPGPPTKGSSPAPSSDTTLEPVLSGRVPSDEIKGCLTKNLDAVVGGIIHRIRSAIVSGVELRDPTTNQVITQDSIDVKIEPKGNGTYFITVYIYVKSDSGERVKSELMHLSVFDKSVKETGFSISSVHLTTREIPKDKNDGSIQLSVRHATFGRDSWIWGREMISKGVIKANKKKKKSDLKRKLNPANGSYGKQYKEGAEGLYQLSPLEQVVANAYYDTLKEFCNKDASEDGAYLMELPDFEEDEGGGHVDSLVSDRPHDDFMHGQPLDLRLAYDRPHDDFMHGQPLDPNLAYGRLEGDESDSSSSDDYFQRGTVNVRKPSAKRGDDDESDFRKPSAKGGSKLSMKYDEYEDDTITFDSALSFFKNRY